MELEFHVITYPKKKKDMSDYTSFNYSIFWEMSTSFIEPWQTFIIVFQLK